MHKPTALLAAMLLSLSLVALVQDASSADLPAHSYECRALEKNYYTNSPSESFFLSKCGAPDAAGYGEIIGGSNMQGNLRVNAAGCPSWITYELFSNRYDVRFQMAPGAVCDGLFWILFDCLDGRLKILVTFKIKVSDGGGVIPDDRYNDFTLKLDGNGNGASESIRGQSVTDSYTFDLSGHRPAREGYKFKGWSTTSGGETRLASESWTLKVVSGKSVTGTLYAQWEKTNIVIPTVWQMIAQLLSEPVFLLLTFGSMGLFALFVRHRGATA